MRSPLPDDCEAELERLLGLPHDDAKAAFLELLERWPSHADRLWELWNTAWPGLRGGSTEVRSESLQRLLRDLLPTDPPPPTAIGPYRVLRQLGSGGMGDVYLATDSRLGREVAVKVLAARFRGHESAVARFVREARAVAALSHPGIGEVYEVGGDDDGLPFFSMEFVPGVLLDAVLERLHDRRSTELTANDLWTALGTAPPAATTGGGDYKKCVAALVAAVARALEHAHQRGVVHRDVKPHNIIVRPDGRPVLLDFGLAQFEVQAQLTRTGDFLGTPRYASPEQVSPRRLAVDHRTDVYSLGVTLFELVTLSAPFEADTTQQLLRQIETKLAPSLRSRDTTVPRDLDAICAMALAKEPQQRYATAADFADDLERFAAGHTVVARPVPAWTRAYRWSRRHPAAAAAAVLLVLLGAALFAAWQQLLARDRVQTALAAARFSSARRWLGEGGFDTALAELADARVRGYPDEGALLLAEFEAHEGRGDFPAAAATLGDITTPPADPALAARLLLLRGDFGVDRIEDPDAGRAAIEAAVATGALEPADAAYARCLLAPDLDSAWQHLQRALDQSPTRRRAGMTAIWLAIARGDAAEADLRYREFLRRFGDDPSLPLLRRALQLIDASGSPAPGGAADAVRDSRSWQSAELLLDGLALLRTVAHRFTDLQQAEQRRDLRAGARILQDLARLRGPALELPKRAQRIRELPVDPAAPAIAVHPTFVRAWRPLVLDGIPGLLKAIANRSADDSLAMLRRCAAAGDDGFFHLLAGYLLGRDRDLVAARAEFQQAIDRPSLMGLRRHALRIQIAFDGGFAAGALPGLTRDDVLPDLERNVLALTVYPDLDDDEWDGAFSSALIGGAADLADVVLANWRRRAPRSVRAMKAEADLAMRRQDFLHGRRVALAALAIDGALDWAIEIRDLVDAEFPR